MSNTRILRDVALGKRESDRFGYSDIADNLIELVKGLEPPFTIGLYGPWGVGKSTICKIVEQELENTSGFRVFYFDTWKYERDSFRRQFLINLDETLFNGALDYRNTLNQSLTLPHSLPFWQALKRSFDSTVSTLASKFLVLVILLALAFAAVLGLNYGFHFLNGTYSEVLQSAVDAIFGIGVVYYLIKFIFESVKAVEGQVAVSRTDSAEGFEYYYKEALKKLGKDEKLLVIIDNLDRLDHERAVAMLSDIKTFLAGDNVEEIRNKSIFLIPCDNEAISRQLKRSYYEELDTEEYLRKFFNLSFKIPKLLDLELDDYVEEKLRETGIPEFTDNHSISFVISRAFRNNPREIIQFINSLILVYLLAQKRSLTSVTAKDKVPFLAKILVMRVRWPEIYDAVENEMVRSAATVAEIVEAIKDEKKFPGIVKCKEFLRATEGIQDDDREEVFFAVKESKEQKTVPEWKAFISAAEDRRDDDLRTAHDSVLKNNHLKALVSLLGDYARKNKTKEAKLMNVLVSVSKLIDKDNLVAFGPFLQSILTHIPTGPLTQRRAEIDFGFVFNESFNALEASVKQTVKSKFVSVVHGASSMGKNDWASTEPDIKLWKVIAKNSGEFDLQKTTLIDAKRMLVNNLQTALATTPMQPTDKSIIRELLPLFYTEFPLNRALYKEAYFLAFHLLQNGNFQSKDELEAVLNSLLKFFDAVGDPPRVSAEELPPFKQLTSQLLALFDGRDFEVQSLIIETLQRTNIDENPQKADIASRTAQYIRTVTRPEDEREKRILKTFSTGKILDLCKEPSIKDALLQRTRAFPELYLMLNAPADFFNASELQQIFNDLISSNAPGLISFAKHIKYKLPDDIKEPVALTMIRAANHSDPAILKEWLKIIEKIGIPGGAHLNDLLTSLRGAFARDATRDVVIEFVRKNENVIGTAQAQEFLPKKSEE